MQFRCHQNLQAWTLNVNTDHDRKNNQIFDTVNNFFFEKDE